MSSALRRSAVLGAGFAFGVLIGAGAGDTEAAVTDAATAAIAAKEPPADVGNADNGKLIYTRCAACHSLTSDRTGPRHCGLLGRRAGSLEGFDFSEAMRASGIVWTTVTLNRFLADPLNEVPGTAMGYGGVTDSRERADLVAFLARESSSAQCTY